MALKNKKTLFLFCLAIFLCLVSGGYAKEHNFQGSLQNQADPVPLLPFLEYYIDETLSLDVEEAASPTRVHLYKPLVLEDLPNVEGITWLRFTISALAPDARPATFLLDMGQSVPGMPILYSPERNELSGALEWQDNAPAQRNILLLPEASSEPITCYIRIDGLPGPWFSPVVRTPQNAANNWGSLARTGAILALGVVMIVCLLRGFSENGQWRIWTSFFVAVALAQSLLGMPVISEKISIWTLAAVLTPGIALMLAPHIGRHLMNSRDHSRAIDIQLALLSLPGAALAIMPLVPGWNWLDRWLDLWPLGMIIFIPTALGAWIAGLKGSLRFLVGMLIPPVLTAISLAGMYFGFPAYLLYSLPLWGVAICAILIASSGAQWEQPEPAETEASAPESPMLLPDNDIIILDHPMEDPNLRIIRPAIPGRGQAKDESRPEKISEQLEKSIREPVDDLMREGVALGNCALPPAAREHAEKMIQDARRLVNVVSGTTISEDYTPEKAGNINFNLQRLLREVTSSLAGMAEQAGTATSWHMPPHMPLWYEGPEDEIKAVLTQLMESSIRASAHGGVRISVKRVPESGDLGYVQFSIADNGAGSPPFERSSVALAKAWELAGNNAGYLDMESGKHGTTISFSMRLDPVEDEDLHAQDASPHIIVASDDPAQRKSLVKMLEGLPFRISEAANESEILVRQSMDPAPFLIAHGKFALPSAADMAHEFANLARTAGFSHTYLLAINKDTSQWPLLKPSGFTHAMTEPVEKEALVETVQSLARNIQLPDAKTAADNSAVDLDERAADIEEAPQDAPSGSQINNEPLDEPEIDINKDEEINPVQDEGKVEEGEKDEEFAPTQIVEQDLKLNYNFDSPDWLKGENTQDDMEWVGEPQPIGAPKATPPDEEKGNPSQDQKLDIKENNPSGPGDTPQKKPEVENADPVIMALVERLEADMKAVQESFSRQNEEGVENATRHIASEAENFGFRHLARMAQCVQRAAASKDLTAVGDLLPDLSQAVERYCIHLIQKDK